MAEKYDVVVVGAGNAGLSAAVSCAAQGKKTLLIEKHNLPGGVASSFKRGRFEFDPSVHETTTRATSGSSWKRMA